MRIRSIKPEFFLDDELASCPHWVRLLFVGLWLIADREGRLEDRPVRIRVQLFPHDQDITMTAFDGGLDQLERIGKINRYQVDGVRLIEIPGFKKHQRPHINERGSSLPKPPLKPLFPTSAPTMAVLEHNQGCREHAGKGREGKGKEGNRGEGVPPTLLGTPSEQPWQSVAGKRRSLSPDEFAETYRTALNAAKADGCDDATARQRATEAAERARRV